MIAHGTVSDSFTVNNSPREIFLPNELLNIFDINLLGHFHTRCKVNKNTYYAGSLLRRGFADEESKRGYSVFDTDTKEYKTYDIWQRPQVDIYASSLNDLKKQLKKVPKNAIVRSNMSIENDFFSFDVKKEMNEKERDNVNKEIKQLNLLLFAKNFLRQKVKKISKAILGKIYKEIYNKI